MPMIATVGQTVCVITSSHTIHCFSGPHVAGSAPVPGRVLSQPFQTRHLVALSKVNDDQPLLLSACEDGGVSLFDTDSGECLREFQVQPRLVCLCPCWGELGEMFLVTGTAEGLAEVTCVDPGRNTDLPALLQPASRSFQAHTDFCRTADLIGDGEVVTSCYDGSLRVATGQREGQTFTVDGDWLLATAGDAASGLLVCGFYGGQVSCLSTRDWRELWVKRKVLSWGSIRAVALSRGALLVAAGTETGAIAVLRAHSGDVVCVLWPRGPSASPALHVVFLRSLATLASCDREGNFVVSRVTGLPQIAKIASLVHAIDSSAILEDSALQRIATTVTRRMFFFD
jgi:hypothetical protein